MNKNYSKVFWPLVYMTIPVIIGMLITFIFQLADTYFIGKLGVDRLAAMSFTYPIYILFIGLFMGMSSGVSSTVAKALGEKNIVKAKSLAAISLTVFVIIGLFLGIIGFVLITPLFKLLGANNDIIGYLHEYMGIMFPGFFLLVGTLIGNSILMAKGIMIPTTLIMAIGGIINIFLDYFLIFGIGKITAMGISGAALATIISWLITFILMTILLIKEKMVSFKVFLNLNKTVSGLKEVFKIGMPSVVAQILNPVAISVITRFIAYSGDSAIASYGIVTKVESLGLTVILALSVILTPFIARLYGAKETYNIEKVIAYSGRITVYWSLLLYLTFILFGKNIIFNFTDNLDVITNSKIYFYIVGLSLPAFGLSHVTTSIFNGAQMPGLSLKLTMVKSLIFTIPLAILGSFIGLYGIFVGISLANIFGAVYSKILLNRWHKETGSYLSGYNPINDYLKDFRSLFLIIRRKK